MPGQETGSAVGLGRTYVGVHVAEVSELPVSLVIKLRKGRYKTVTLGGGQTLGILADSYHAGNFSNQSRCFTENSELGASFNLHVAVGDTRSAEFSRDKKRNKRTVSRHGQRQAICELARCAFPEHNHATFGSGHRRELYADYL